MKRDVLTLVIIRWWEIYRCDFSLVIMSQSDGQLFTVLEVVREARPEDGVQRAGIRYISTPAAKRNALLRFLVHFISCWTGLTT
jgi:c-di-GMP-binding flagellar brake protein YcgR